MQARTRAKPVHESPYQAPISGPKRWDFQGSIILVKMVETAETKGGVLLDATTVATHVAEVIRVGKGMMTHGPGHIERAGCLYKVGDTVLVPATRGFPIDLGGETYHIYQEHEVWAKQLGGE